MESIFSHRHRKADESLASAFQKSDDRLAQRLYAWMHERGESLAEAAKALGLTSAEVDVASDRLVQLGLLNPTTQVTVETPTALAQCLNASHHVLDRLVEQQVVAASLVRNYLGVVRQGRGDAQVEFLEREDSQTLLSQRIDEFVEMARHEALTMHPAANWARAPLYEGAVRNRQMIGRGVRVRMMHAQIMLSDSMVREFLRSSVAARAEVRVAPVIPTRMNIYDRQVAIVQADPEDLQAGAVVIRGKDVVRSLAAIYDYCWMTASELHDVPKSTEAGPRTEQQQAVLRMLAAGAKDETIARSMGVSTRTVTRLVSELTAMLGAESRFQAGVRAAKLGWLD